MYHTDMGARCCKWLRNLCVTGQQEDDQSSTSEYTPGIISLSSPSAIVASELITSQQVRWMRECGGGGGVKVISKKFVIVILFYSVKFIYLFSQICIMSHKSDIIQI